MIEALFIVIPILIVYVIYEMVREQKTTPHSQTPQEKPEKPFPAAVKPSTPRSALKSINLADVKLAALAQGKPMLELVGTTAGTIWSYLDKNGATTVAKLIRELPENEKTIHRSIGWLAQEDKITLKIVDRAETIALK